MESQLIFKHGICKRGVYSEDETWRGSFKLTEQTTLHYEIVLHHEYYHTSVGTDAKFKEGVFYEVEDLLDTLDQAKAEISRFVNVVKNNPSKYEVN